MRTRDEHKEHIVYQKAIDLIVEEGLSGFSMQKLARAAGVSPATLYIYYRDKEDLILQLGISEGKRMTEATLRDFDPMMPFAEGLRVQWRNRAAFWLENRQAANCYEQLRHSAFGEKIAASIQQDFSTVMGIFLHNAIERKELKPLPVELFWAIAYGPLFSLVKFHQDGKGIGGRPFVLTEAIMEEALALVLKALKP